MKTLSGRTDVYICQYPLLYIYIYKYTQIKKENIKWLDKTVSSNTLEI